MKNMSTLYQHLRAELVPPRVRTLAAAWQVWDSAQEGAGDTIHIDYDGKYGSERVLIVSGRMGGPMDNTLTTVAGSDERDTPVQQC